MFSVGLVEVDAVEAADRECEDHLDEAEDAMANIGD